MARVIVYDFAIQGLFNPGESAVEWTKDVIDTILARAENLEVPRGNAQSGRIRQGWKSLRNSHKSTGVLRRGPYGAGGAAYNDAPHAAWVHNGTTGPILPRSSAYLALPVAPGTLVRRANDTWGAGGRRNRAGGRAQPSRSIVLVTSVRGQDANPWLKRAGDGAVAEFRAKAVYRRSGATSRRGFRTP